MQILNSTPIMIVDRIEPVLGFWEGTLGYTREVEVPHEGSLGFVILKKDDREVMFQTRASIQADLPAVLSHVPERNGVVQFVEVDSLDDLLRAFQEKEMLIPPRTTFYGMREIVVRDPAGFVIVFAQKA